MMFVSPDNRAWLLPAALSGSFTRQVKVVVWTCSIKVKLLYQNCLLLSDFFLPAAKIEYRPDIEEEPTTSNLVWTTQPQQADIQLTVGNGRIGHHRTHLRRALNIYFMFSAKRLFSLFVVLSWTSCPFFIYTWRIAAPHCLKTKCNQGLSNF